MSTPEREKIWSIIETFPTAMVSTFSDGLLRSRPMHLPQKEFAGQLYFFVPFDSDIVTEIGKEPEINAAIVNQDTATFLSLSGPARVSSNKHLFEALWDDDLNHWFPKGEQGGEALLIEMDVMQGESWKTNSGGTRLYERIRSNVMKDASNFVTHEEFTNTH